MHQHSGIRVDSRVSYERAFAFTQANRRLDALNKAVAALPPAQGSSTAVSPEATPSSGVAVDLPPASVSSVAAQLARASGSNAADTNSSNAPVVISDTGRALATQPPSVAPDSVTRVDHESHARLRASETINSTEVKFDFEVTTQDGDKVKIIVDLLDSTTELKARGRDADGTRFRAHSSSSTTSRAVSIAVEGSLDDGELAAIDKLSSSVVDLAQRFLSGDDRGALDKALSLNFDSSELTTFALHLSQSQTQSVTRVKLRGDAALEGLAQLDSAFADQTKNIGDAIRGLIYQPNDDLDPATIAQVVAQLLPPLLGPVSSDKDGDRPPVGSGADAAPAVVTTSSPAPAPGAIGAASRSGSAL